MGTVRKENGRGTRRAKAGHGQRVSADDESNGSAARIRATEVGAGVEAVRMRAYELFLERGATHGNDLADWFKAEQELIGAQRL